MPTSPLTDQEGEDKENRSPLRKKRREANDGKGTGGKARAALKFDNVEEQEVVVKEEEEVRRCIADDE